MIRLRLLAARRQQASAIRRVTDKPEVIGSPVGLSSDKRACGHEWTHSRIVGYPEVIFGR